jgi:PhzF family phenazine biosynthesis protein
MKAYIASAFSRNGSGGNRAGIIPDAERFTPEQKQAIAARIGLSETAFILKDEEADYLLEFYTPVRQIANCGHATLASFGLLQQMRRLKKNQVSMRTLSGVSQIWVRGNRVIMEQHKPFFQLIHIDHVIASLGIEKKEIILPITVINTGNSFLIIELNDEKTLGALQPDLQLVKKISEELDLIGYYVFVRKQGRPDAVARMFAPRYGIDEESATGMAAGPLACYLHTVRNAVPLHFTFYQGDFMTIPSPSALYVELNIENDQVKNLYVSGDVKIETEVEIDLDD